MTDYWRTVDTIDDDGRTLALQQRVRLPDVNSREVPTDDHRLVPVKELLEE